VVLHDHDDDVIVRGDGYGGCRGGPGHYDREGGERPKMTCAVPEHGGPPRKMGKVDKDAIRVAAIPGRKLAKAVRNAD
jgi:hypothetical protein